MKRYSLVTHSRTNCWRGGIPDHPVTIMTEEPSGEYVRYEDIDGMVEQLKQLQELVNKQAGDIGLWCQPQTIVEDYIQQALRELHGAIEREDMSWLKTTSDDESA